MFRTGWVGGVVRGAIFCFLMASCGEGGGSLGGGPTGPAPSVGGGGGTGGVGVGQIDTTFGQDGGTITPIASSGDIDEANAVAIQPDGKIVLAGHSDNGSGTGKTDFAVVRYRADGSLDTTFDGDGKVTTFTQDTTPADGFGDTNAIAHAVAVQSDGKIVVAGSSDADFALIRYNTDGTVDTTFSGDGIVVTAVGGGVDAIRAMALQPDGKIVVAGESSGDFVVARYNTDGTLDASFGGGGIVVTAMAGSNTLHALAIQPDGKVVVAGVSGGRFALARYSAAGVLDPAFGLGGVVDGGPGQANAIALLAGGKIVVGGFVSGGSNRDFALLRFGATGAPDLSFGLFGKVVTSVGSGDAEINGLVVYPSGRIVAAGFADNGTNLDFALVGYTETGVLDVTFGETGQVITPISDFEDVARAVALQADGKVVVAGSADADFVVVRYDAPGP